MVSNIYLEHGAYAGYSLWKYMHPIVSPFLLAFGGLQTGIWTHTSHKHVVCENLFAKHLTCMTYVLQDHWWVRIVIYKYGVVRTVYVYSELTWLHYDLLNKTFFLCKFVHRCSIMIGKELRSREYLTKKLLIL